MFILQFQQLCLSLLRFKHIHRQLYLKFLGFLVPLPRKIPLILLFYRSKILLIKLKTVLMIQLQSIKGSLIHFESLFSQLQLLTFIKHLSLELGILCDQLISVCLPIIVTSHRLCITVLLQFQHLLYHTILSLQLITILLYIPFLLLYCIHLVIQHSYFIPQLLLYYRLHLHFSNQFGVFLHDLSVEEVKTTYLVLEHHPQAQLLRKSLLSLHTVIDNQLLLIQQLLILLLQYLIVSHKLRMLVLNTNLILLNNSVPLL